MGSPACSRQSKRNFSILFHTTWEEPFRRAMYSHSPHGRSRQTNARALSILGSSKRKAGSQHQQIRSKNTPRDNLTPKPRCREGEAVAYEIQAWMHVHNRCPHFYKSGLKFHSQIWCSFFLPLLTTSVSTCLQHSRNLGTVI